ncbi:hypothetical protein Tsubulata_013119 [Turnera subulata]|uniref:Uncharacterized protein n=1 Tax=Turnera subulata TaxID=218843 RepID=A0A9Q0J6H4_9ROSI|nr:hypothetical protein Tsubulata_013119 [Turnera subulata]
MLRARVFAGTIMSESGHLLSAQTSKVIPSSYPSKTGRNKLRFQPCKIIAASKKKTDLDLSLVREKKSRNPRQLIRLPMSDGNWSGNLTCEYQFSFRELQLEDLVADDGQEETQHAIFGFSVEGKINTTFNGICSNCSSPYCREV